MSRATGLAGWGGALGALFSLGLMGCGGEDDALPQGAFLATFHDPGADCPVAGHNAAVGEISATKRTKVVADGEGGARISCTVRGSSSFSVEAQATMADKTLQIVIDSISADATKEAPALGRVGFTTPNSVNTYLADATSPCSFYFSSDVQGVGPGKIWVTFVCPEISAQGGSTCDLKQSYAIFENCDR